jgi:hypothetical protein
MLRVYLDNCCYNRPFDDLTQKKIEDYRGRKGFDYTKWRENLWDDLTLDEVFERAQAAQLQHGVPDSIELI